MILIGDDIIIIIIIILINQQFLTLRNMEHQQSPMYCGELPFDLMYDLIKWKFLTRFSDVPVRFHVLYELNRHKVDSYILKYDHFKCSRSVISNYFVNFIANRK